ncbi:MAG: NAD(P)-dependent oxidoreductase [Methylococcaceae bacterium]|jgi:3-hydroxyisobutyrate dehydrogenase|nr:NAD(P)-dependent oxidoreductase [Methylococcaceae bacterium]
MVTDRETEKTLKVGFIGLGSMGAAMARNAAKVGLLDAVWNRTADKAELLARELGVVRAATPADLAGRVEVILLCVSADRDVLEVIENLLPALHPGQIVVDFSTVSRDTAVAAAQLIRATGAAFLDAPVTGGMEGARNATLAIMVGGEAATLERVRPVLAALSNRIVHMGEVGMGQSAKAVNQVMCAGINEAVTEALAFGARLGLDMDKVIEVVSGGAAGNWFLEKRGPTMTRGTFKPGFKLALHEKDLTICEAMAEAAGMTLPMTAMTAEHYRQLMAEGHGDEDISALYRLKRPAA